MNQEPKSNPEFADNKSNAENTEVKSETKTNGLSGEEFAAEERILQQFPFYHGFIPREDIPTLLINNGDYLMRLSEYDPIKGAPAQEQKKEIVLSVNVSRVGSKDSTKSAMDDISGKSVQKNTKSVVSKTPAPAGKPEKEKKAPIRHVIIHHVDNKYYVEAGKNFDSVKDLHDFYTKNFCKLTCKKFMLKNPILLQDWEHLHKDITLDKLLGEGAFGEVRQGVLVERGTGKQIDVAIKLLKGTSAMVVGKEKIKEMMNEARLMRNFKHKNVVRMHGVAVHQQPIYIILELIRGGALSSYLKKNAGNLSMKEKMNIVYGAALGIDFLHKNMCIHRDLAARNCLYTDDYVIKISDFGLSKIACHYPIKSATRLPIKWLSPETITGRYFNFKTDVYSYGVILYEIFSEGGDPWDGKTTTEVKQALKEGKFLTLPESCPEKMSNFVREKIYTTEAKRATMSEICKYLFANATELEVDISQHEPQAPSPPVFPVSPAPATPQAKPVVPAAPAKQPPSVAKKASVKK